MKFNIKREDGKEIDCDGLKLISKEPNGPNDFYYEYEIEINSLESLMTLYYRFGNFRIFQWWKDSPITIEFTVYKW